MGFKEFEVEPINFDPGLHTRDISDMAPFLSDKCSRTSIQTQMSKMFEIKGMEVRLPIIKWKLL
jgi:hypothetical protein